MYTFISLGKIIKSKQLARRVDKCLTYLKTDTFFYHAVIPFYIPPSSA